MITFINLGQHGRLGNQLFQYAALKGIALHNGYECKIPNPSSMYWHGQKCLLSEFNIESEHLTAEDIQTIQNQMVEPSPHLYYQDFMNIPDNTNIHGFFQSVHYFQNYKDQICKELTPKDRYMKEAKAYIEELREDKYEVVSIHLRRGDNTDGTNPSEIKFYGTDDILDQSTVYGSYLKKALKEFEGKPVKYLVFTGGSRTGDDSADIEWAKKNFNDTNIVVSNTNSAMMDFSRIMACDHNIACHMTSFGWWAAYLNPNPNKIVVAPKNYFYDLPRHYIRPGHLPDTWRLV